MLNIALPKGRLGDKAYSLFEKAGFMAPDIMEDNRKLIFTDETGTVSFFKVKPADVSVYVERGAADIGIVGKDILLEHEREVYELMDTGLGKCFMAVASTLDFKDNKGETLRVATKFDNIAREYYKKQGRDIDIIHLNGSIELAPLLRLSDVIVDIVETGETLRENKLKVYDRILDISARLIAGRSAYQFKRAGIDTVVDRLRSVL